MRTSRYLVTINLGGNYIPPNVYSSHAHAAGRWGAQYLQLTSPWGGTGHLWWMKMRMHALELPMDSRVVFIDGDAVIRQDCPDLFGMADDDVFCAVRNPSTTASVASAADWWGKCAGLMRCSLEFDSARYVNGGLMVYSPRHHNRIWEYLWSAPLAVNRTGPLFEQTFLNMALRMLDVPLHLLPDGFNSIGPHVWEPGPMRDYIYHFADSGGQGKEGLRDALEAVDWRIPEVVNA